MSGVLAALSAGKVAFTPLSLGAALIEWWDARTSTYLTLGAGNAISNVAGRKGAHALTQATSALQPIWDASGLIKFDAATSNGDYLNLALSSPVAQGQVYFLTSFGWYKSGVANWTAVTHRINCADVSQIIFINAGAITSAQRTALETYLGVTSVFWCVKTLNTSIYNRIDNTPDVNYTLSYTGGNAAAYSLASAQAGATVDVAAQGLTAPVAMRFPSAVGADSTLQYFHCGSNQLTGSIPSLAANTALQYFYCNSNQLTGSIPSLAANTALQYFHGNSNQLTGSIPSLAANTALREFYCSSNQLTSSIPSLAANTALQYFLCGSNQLTSYTGGGVSNTLSTFDASTNQLPAAAINSILADFVAAGRAGGTLTLNGTGNAAPTGQGLIDKAALSGLGWTVTTN